MKYFVFFVCLLMISISSQQEGDACLRYHDHSLGVCAQVQDCPKVIEEYNNGIGFSICTYVNEQPVVCCPTHEESIATIREVGEISTQKCVEYSKHVKKEIQISSLSLDAHVHTVSVSQCDFTSSLIVGGQKTLLGEYPHMAAIGWRDLDGNLQFYCGGSLVSERFVLTAAHCGQVQGKPPVLVRLGDQNLKSSDDGAMELDYAIDQFISHEKYSRKSRYYDIAVIRLTQDVTFSKFIRPACLWQSSNINQTKAIATGWGYTKSYGETSDELMKVSLDIINNVKCNKITPQDKMNKGIMESQLCAGALDGGKDTCNGDSGAPLQIIIPGHECIYHLIGVTSFGSPHCGLRNSAGIFTRISSYLEWIELKVWA